MLSYARGVSQAIIYAKHFGVSVLPVGDNKKPIVEWAQWQDRVPYFDEIIGWPESGFNLAIITGAVSGGLVVVDCESREDAKWFYENRGKSNVIVKTRRGYHLYFRSSSLVKNAQRVEGRYDVRGEGGYVVAPPSTHTDGKYDWVTPLSAVEDLPEFNLAWRPEREESQYQENDITDGAAYISMIQATSGQGGHNETYRAVCKLKASGMDMAEAMLVLQKWNETNAHPKWSDRELLHKIKDVYYSENG